METNRLIIRKFTIDDFQDFSELIRNKMKSEYAVYDEQFPTDNEPLKGVLSYFKDSDEFFAVELKTVSKVIGFVSLNYVNDSVRNLGYCIHTDYQGNGYAREAVAEIKRYARDDLRINKLISGTAEENEPSVKLLISSGFTITEKHPASFVNDENGNPIVFTGCSFECILLV